MKKLLGIVVLGLLFAANALAENFIIMETLENQNFVIQPHPDDPTAYPKINGAFAIESLTKICARAYLTISGLPRFLNKDWKVDVSVDVTLK